jgi:hypothetical protein
MNRVLRTVRNLDNLVGLNGVLAQFGEFSAAFARREHLARVEEFEWIE